MGADFYPTTLIGVRIPMDKIIKIEKGIRLKAYEDLPMSHKGDIEGKLACPEFEITNTTKYCPHCGCNLYESYKNEVPLVPGLHLDTRNCGHQKYKEWVMAYDSNKNYLFIGFYALEGDQEGDCAYIGLKHKIDGIEIEIKKTLLETDLKKVGLWDEDNFGLWLFMFNSY